MRVINSLGSHQHVQKEGWKGEGSQSPEAMGTVKCPQVLGHLPIHREGQDYTPVSSRLHSPFPLCLDFADNRMEKTKVMSCT